MFTFKQFVVKQDKCGMKVCIDSCIFGASTMVLPNQKVLDIGTGTGLLSLLLAQKAKLHIDAIEIDKEAFLQASQNINESPFTENIKTHHSTLAAFEETDYDLIICNPPFYSGQLSSPDPQRNRAMHQESLKLEDLALEINQKLNKNGLAHILLPPTEMAHFKTLMKPLGFSTSREIHIKHNPVKSPFREMVVFSREKSIAQVSEFIIRETDNVTYTEEFQTLMKDYYIIF